MDHGLAIRLARISERAPRSACSTLAGGAYAPHLRARSRAATALAAVNA